MTVTATTPRGSWPADGSTRRFPLGYKVFADTDITVWTLNSTGSVSSKALGVDYTVENIGADSGTLVFNVAPSAGQTVKALRQLPLTQMTAFKGQTQFYPELHEAQSDREVMIAQQLQEALDRTSHVSQFETMTAADMEWPALEVRKGKYWYWDSVTGKLVPVSNIGTTTLSSDLIGQTLGSLTRSSSEITAGVVPSNYAYAPGDFRRYGAVADGATDNTATIVAVLAAFGSTFSGRFYAAPNVKFDFNAVTAAMPPRAVLQDESQVNAWNTAGFRQKAVGYAEGADSSAVNDFQQFISSGHNAALNLDNRGTAASTSGTNGVAMVQWTRGRLKKQSNENGFRALARVEFSKIPGVNKWWYILRRGVPWEANAWEYWYTGKSYVTGDYVLNGTGVYKATTTGTAGASAPVHTSGTVSDGGVSWQSILPNLDSGVFGIDQHGQIFTNTSPVDAVVAYLKADKYSPGAGQANLYVEADGVSQDALLRLRPTNGAGAVSVQPVIRAQDGVGVRFMKSDSTDEYFRLDDTNGFTWQANPVRKRVTVTYSASMTLDAKLGESQIITATNGSAFTINAPTNPLAGRRLAITLRNTSGGALGAATWNAVFKMSAWTNPANGFSRSVEFEYDGAAWVQVAQTGADIPN